MKQGPPTEPTEEQGPRVLSFEEFSHRKSDYMNTPCYGGFFQYFRDGTQGDARRTTEHYRRFAMEHPDMAESLHGKIQSLSYVTSNSLIPFDKDLYEAYKIMRGYGISDNILLSG